MKIIEGAFREGTFDNRAGYRRRARRALELTRGEKNRYELAMQERKGITFHPGKGAHEIGQAIDDYRIAADGTILFAALAVESALNFYGVVRLGEKFYQSHYERLGITAKLSALLATCLGKLVEKGDRVLVVVLKLSEYRNSLAHPKTIELADDRKALHPRDLLREAESAVELMEEFFGLFVELDGDAIWIAQMA